MVTISFLFGALIIYQNLVLFSCQSYGGEGPWENQDGNVETLVAQTESSHDVIDDRWTYSTPSTPRPQDVNCYVEVPTTVTVGGTCVRYGASGNIWLCQSGVNAQVSMECSLRALAQPRGRNHRRRVRRRSP